MPSNPRLEEEAKRILTNIAKESMADVFVKRKYLLGNFSRHYVPCSRGAVYLTVGTSRGMFARSNVNV